MTTVWLLDVSKALVTEVKPATGTTIVVSVAGGHEITPVDTERNRTSITPLAGITTVLTVAKTLPLLDTCVPAGIELVAVPVNVPITVEYVPTADGLELSTHA
jgi:hypothetical protein